MAPSVAAAAQALGRQVAKLPSVQKKKKAAREETLKQRARYKAVRRFLAFPRWYQDIIRPHFRGQRRKYGNRPTSDIHQALAMQAADDKRRRRRERNLRNEMRSKDPMPSFAQVAARFRGYHNIARHVPPAIGGAA